MPQQLQQEQKQQQEQEIVVVEYENTREGHGRNIALIRRVYRLLNSDVYYVESETSNNIYYFVKFKPDVFEICSCPDSWTRHTKCKHLFAIEYAIMKGTLKDIDQLPAEAKRYPTVVTATKDWRDDSYDF